MIRARRFVSFEPKPSTMWAHFAWIRKTRRHALMSFGNASVKLSRFSAWRSRRRQWRTTSRAQGRARRPSHHGRSVADAIPISFRERLGGVAHQIGSTGPWRVLEPVLLQVFGGENARREDRFHLHKCLVKDSTTASVMRAPTGDFFASHSCVHPATPSNSLLVVVSYWITTVIRGDVFKFSAGPEQPATPPLRPPKRH